MSVFATEVATIIIGIIEYRIFVVSLDCSIDDAWILAIHPHAAYIRSNNNNSTAHHYFTS